jgi:diaminopimelate epimerase
MATESVPRLHFTKMQGAGNDYVYFDMFSEPNSLLIQPETKVVHVGEKIIPLADVAVKLSHRRYGVGGDGIIIINTPDVSTDDKIHGEMIMYNADGSMAEMCGNGLSCVALYLHTHIYADRRRDPNYCNELSILTGAGVKKANITHKNESMMVQLAMGAPRMNQDILKRRVTLAFNSQLVHAHLHYVSMGNPHVVVFIEDTIFEDGSKYNELETFPVEILGPQLENHELFPDRANVEFVRILDAGRAIVQQRTWERGSGETMACGTGACAVAFMSDEMGKINGKNRTITVKLRGGDLLFDLERQESTCSQIIMYAQPVEVFSGTIDITK